MTGILSPNAGLSKKGQSKKKARRREKERQLRLFESMSDGAKETMLAGMRKRAQGILAKQSR